MLTAVVRGLLIMSRDTKDCAECNSELPLSEFRTDFRYLDQLFPLCEFCFREFNNGVRDFDHTRFPQSDKI